MNNFEAAVAFDAICDLIEHSQSNGVMFNYALARNRRILEPLVTHYRLSLLICDSDSAAELAQREITDQVIYPILLSWFPIDTNYQIIDLLYPLIAE
jgi:hypothetical protein